MECFIRKQLILTVWLFFLSFPSLAGIPEGLQYLSSQWQPDGTIASQETIATPYQSTSESIATWSILADSNKSVLSAGLDALQQSALDTTEHLSRLIIAKADLDYNTYELADRLLTYQNSDGGFGELEGYQSTALDTVFALQALAKAGRTSTQTAARALYYLVNQQSQSGYFSLANNQASVYVTSLASITL